MKTVDIINDRCYFFGNHFDQSPTPHHSVFVQTTSHDSANDVKFIRENKSPEGKSVEFLNFGVLENAHHFCAKYIR